MTILIVSVILLIVDQYDDGFRLPRPARIICFVLASILIIELYLRLYRFSGISPASDFIPNPCLQRMITPIVSQKFWQNCIIVMMFLSILLLITTYAFSRPMNDKIYTIWKFILFVSYACVLFFSYGIAFFNSRGPIPFTVAQYSDPIPIIVPQNVALWASLGFNLIDILPISIFFILLSNIPYKWKHFQETFIFMISVMMTLGIFSIIWENYSNRLRQSDNLIPISISYWQSHYNIFIKEYDQDKLKRVCDTYVQNQNQYQDHLRRRRASRDDPKKRHPLSPNSSDGGGTQQRQSLLPKSSDGTQPLLQR